MRRATADTGDVEGHLSLAIYEDARGSVRSDTLRAVPRRRQRLTQPPALDPSCSGRLR